MADQRRASIIPAPVTRDPSLNDSAKIVAQGIGLFMDRHGKCWPGTDAIAAAVHKSVATVERGIAALKARKHLTVTRRARRSAVLEWNHPMIPHLLRGQDDVMIPQIQHDDPSLLPQKQPHDPSLHVTRARIEREQLTSSIERGDQPAQTERKKNRYHTAASEMPVQDLHSRQPRTADPSPLAGSLTRFLTKPDP